MLHYHFTSYQDIDTHPKVIQSGTKETTEPIPEVLESHNFYSASARNGRKHQLYDAVQSGEWTSVEQAATALKVGVRTIETYLSELRITMPNSKINP